METNQAKKVEYSFNKKPMFFIVLANVLSLVACLVFFVPRSLNNDDYLLNMLLGTAYGEGSPITVYTNIVFGAWLEFIYSVVPSVNWVALVEYILLFISFCMVSFIVLKTKPDLLGFCLFAALVFAIAPYCYLSLHYTKVAIVSAFCGAVAVYFSDNLKSETLCFFGIIICLFSSFLRFSAFLFGVGVAFFVVFSLVLFEKKHKNILDFIKFNLNLIKKYCVCFGAVLLFFIIQTIYYEIDVDANQYKDYLNARVAVSDYSIPSFSEHSLQYEQLGLSQNDIDIIENWSFGDLEFFPTELLNDIKKIETADESAASISVIINKYYTEILCNNLFLFSVFAALTAFLITDKKVYLGRILIVFGGVSLLYLVMCFMGRTTRWVNAGLVVAFAVGVMMVMLKSYKKPQIKRLNSAISFAVCGLFFVGGFLGNDEIILNSPNQNHYNDNAFDVYNEVSKNKQNLYLFDLLGSPDLETSGYILDGLPTGIFENVYFLGGWDTGSVVKNSVLERFEAGGSPYRSLVEKNNVFLVDTKSYDMKHKFLKQHISDDITMSLVDIAAQYYVFGFCSQDINPDINSEILPHAIHASESPYIPTYIHIELTLDNMFNEQDEYMLKLWSSESDDEIYFKAGAKENGIYTILTADIPITELEKGATYQAFGIINGSVSESSLELPVKG